MGDLQPITREYLREFYKAYPIEPLKPEVLAMKDELPRRIKAILDEAKIPAAQLAEHAIEAPPKRMDHNMYIHRWQCEEMELVAKELLKCESVQKQASEKARVEQLGQSAAEMGAKFAQFQLAQAEHVRKLIAEFLPNDFRVTLLNRRRESKEVYYKSQIDALAANGGTIKQKYDLMWEQQFDRRKGLADLGAATGIYRAVIKILAGCPDVLLDFAKQINAPLGPTEEMRILYGPNLYELTRIANDVHRLFRAVLLAEKATPSPRLSANLAHFGECLAKYCGAASEYLDFMTVIVENSPMFVSADTLAKSRENQGAGDVAPFTEVAVAARDELKVKVEVPHEARSVARAVSVYYEITASKDIKFGVQRQDGSWLKPLDSACARGAHEMGRAAVDDGSVAFVFDNKFSRMTRKTVQYRYVFVIDNEPPPSWVRELIDAGHI